MGLRMDCYLCRGCFKRMAILILAFLLLGSGFVHAQLAQNLMLGNAKALALGNAVTADPPGIDSIHFNPAGLARLKGRQSHLKFILAKADVSGKFSTNPVYDDLVSNLPQNPDGTLVDPDVAANSESGIESFAIYLPGNGITEIPFAAAPLGGISFNPPGSKMTFATAVYAPMMLGVTRADDDPGIYAGKSFAISRLTFFSPSIGYQVSDTLAVGLSIGFSYVGFGLNTEYRAPNFAVGGLNSILDQFCSDDLLAASGIDNVVDLCKGAVTPFDSIYNLKVDVEKAVSTTFNVGVLWDVTPWLTWGVAYQSEASDILEGDMAITFSPDIVEFYQGLAGVDSNGDCPGNFCPFSSVVEYLGIPLDGSAIESKGSTTLVTPQHISTGISLMLTPRLKVNVDVKWTETSTWESFRFEFDRSIELLGILGALGVSGVETNALEIPRGYEDTVNWGVGFEYGYSDNLKLRLGYEPRQTGIPDDKLDFVLPLGDMELYAVGFSYAIDKFTTFDATLGYTKSYQDIPTGSSTNGNDTRGDNFVYNPYAGLDVETTLEVVMLEFSYQSHF